ncbi:MAG: hypothetical protein ABI140_20745 [Jatrophihabitantaceae bacterium]
MSIEGLFDERYLAVWQGILARQNLAAKAAADTEALEEQLHRPGFAYAYPPPAMTGAVEAELKSVGPMLARLITDLPQRAFGDDLAAWARFLGLSRADRELMIEAASLPTFRDRALLFMRPDLMVTDGGLRLTELNVSSSIGGMNIHDPYVQALGGLWLTEILREHDLRLVAPNLASTWLKAFAQAVGELDRPCTVFAATADPADKDSGWRFLFSMLEANGYQTCGGLVTDLDVGEEGVRYEGKRIDVVFTAYLWYESKRYVPAALTRQLMDLDRQNLITFINTPGCALFDSKVNLELAYHPDYSHLLREDEHRLVRRYLPETFRLTGETYDRALREQRRLVCKPALAYSGKGVSYGQAMSAIEWQAMLTERLADRDQEAYVCQERLPVAAVAVPAMDGEARQIALGPLVFGGEYAGTFYRHMPATENSVINAANGAQVAAMLTCG